MSSSVARAPTQVTPDDVLLIDRGFQSPASRFLPFTQGGYRTPHLLRKKWHKPRRILDPGGNAPLKWNSVFLVTCLVALFLDPFYFYLMFIAGPACMKIDQGIGITVTFFRTVADLFYLAHMLLEFRTALVAPSSRMFGRGELVKDPHQIAMKYLKGDFIIDLATLLQIPSLPTYQGNKFMEMQLWRTLDIYGSPLIFFLMKTLH